MKCPVCEKRMDSPVCICGYDESRSYGKYPTLGRLPKGTVSAAGLRNRRNNMVLCAKCGGYSFALNRKNGALACLSCGRALSEAELKPLTDALGMKKAQTAEKTNAVKQPVVPDMPKERVPGRNDPKRIVSIAAAWYHTVALYADGTVAAIGENRDDKCDVSSWRDIVAISAGYSCTTGLKKDGTVVQTGNGGYKMASWKDIVAIADGYHHTVGLKRDGTVVATGYTKGGRCNVSHWRNIQAIAAGNMFTLGLERSGRVVMAGENKNIERAVQRWKDIKAIAVGFDHCVALDSSGNVHIAGKNSTLPAQGAPFTDLDAGGHFTVALRKDGTVAAAGEGFSDRRSAVEDWKDIVKIVAAYDHTIGLKKDGTLVTTGKNETGQCDVQKLMRK